MMSNCVSSDNKVVDICEKFTRAPFSTAALTENKLVGNFGANSVLCSVFSLGMPFESET